MINTSYPNFNLCIINLAPLCLNPGSATASAHRLSIPKKTRVLDAPLNLTAYFQRKSTETVGTGMHLKTANLLHILIRLLELVNAAII